MAEWAFLTNHASVLLCIARQPGLRIRDIAVHTGLTERAVSRLISDLCDAGYLTKHRLGLRNRYELHPELPLRGAEADGHRVSRLLQLALDHAGQTLRPAQPTPEPA